MFWFAADLPTHTTHSNPRPIAGRLPPQSGFVWRVRYNAASSWHSLLKTAFVRCLCADLHQNTNFCQLPINHMLSACRDVDKARHCSETMLQGSAGRQGGHCTCPGLRRLEAAAQPHHPVVPLFAWVQPQEDAAAAAGPRCSQTSCQTSGVQKMAYAAALHSLY